MLGHLWSISLIVALVLAGVLAAVLLGQVSRLRRRVRRFAWRLRQIHQRHTGRLLARARRAERLAEVGTLTGGLAHEIKNPLSTIQLNLQLLQEDISPDNPAYPRLVNRLATVQREAARLRDILDDFLRYAGKIELDRRRVDLNVLLEELADFFAPQAQAQRVQLRLRKHPSPLLANIDPGLIKQAVLNLMLNALQAMSAGGGELILQAGPANNQVRLDVIDTGPGIPADVVGKIFQAYYSTKKGGTGLGLAMTHRIIEEHGGAISVTSAVGKGSDFTVLLPADADHHPPAH